MNGLATTPLVLKDIHLPTATGFWPLAVGWWVLLVLVVLLLIVIVIWLNRWRRSPARAALKELEKLRLQQQSDQQMLQQCAALVRRSAIALYPCESTQVMHGQQWCDFLMSKHQFSESELFLLSKAQYQPAPNIERQQVIIMTQRWLKAHRLRGVFRAIKTESAKGSYGV